MSLSDIAIKNAKYTGTNYRLADDKGLYLLVKEAGISTCQERFAAYCHTSRHTYQ